MVKILYFFRLILYNKSKRWFVWVFLFTRPQFLRSNLFISKISVFLILYILIAQAIPSWWSKKEKLSLIILVISLIIFSLSILTKLTRFLLRTPAPYSPALLKVLFSQNTTWMIKLVFWINCASSYIWEEFQFFFLFYSSIEKFFWAEKTRK